METLLDCNISKKCNSCQLNNLCYERQLGFKYSKCIKFLGQFCKIDNVIKMDYPFEYRNKAQAVFRVQKDKSVRWGMYKSTTKTAVIADSCRLHTKRANEIFDTLCALIKSFKIPIYDPYKATGWLKSAVVREGFLSKEVMLVLNASTPVFPAKKTFVSAILKKHPYISTIVTTINPDRTKLFVGKTSNILYGDGFIKDTLCNKSFLISPQSFYQINPIQTEKLYTKAIELIELNKNQTILDCYCGIGTIGICASDKVKKVYAVESNHQAVKDAIKNAKLNNIKNISFTNADATDFIKQVKDSGICVDCAFVDPPRAGCSKAFLQSLSDMRVKKIVYISCNIETQARDVRFMKKLGYRVDSCTPVDMFPHTNHIETVVKLSHEKA